MPPSREIRSPRSMRSSTPPRSPACGDHGITFMQSIRLATDHVIAACKATEIRNLVFTSSPSVTFNGEHQRGVDESEPYATRWLCHYPHTKALAEQAVLGSHQPGRLHTLALRPHLIWGEDDPHILPRMLDRARQRAVFGSSGMAPIGSIPFT